MPHLVTGINFLVLCVNFIPVHLSLTYLYMLLPHLLTLSTHHSPSISPCLLHSRPRPTSPRIFPNTDLLSASDSSMNFMNKPFLPSSSFFSFFVASLLFLFGFMWQIKLVIRQLFGARRYIVPYRTVTAELITSFIISIVLFFIHAVTHSFISSINHSFIH